MHRKRMLTSEIAHMINNCKNYNGIIKKFISKKNIFENNICIIEIHQNLCGK